MLYNDPQITRSKTVQTYLSTLKKWLPLVRTCTFMCLTEDIFALMIGTDLDRSTLTAF